MIIHYISIGLCTVLPCLGVAIAQGWTSQSAIEAINRQPAAKSDISRATLLGLALIETAGLLGFICSMLLLFEKKTGFYSLSSHLSSALAISIPGCMIGIAAAYPACAALEAIARQPFIAKKIMNFMLLTQSLIQTPLIFGFIIALILRNQFALITNVDQLLIMIAAGLCIGLACIGPAMGVARFTESACQAIGSNRLEYGKIVSFTIISQAIIETPVIFAAITSFWIISKATAPLTLPYVGYVYLAIAFVMGVGTFGPGLSSGNTAKAAVKEIGHNQLLYGILSRTSMIAQGIIDTCAIYAFIIAISLILGS